MDLGPPGDPPVEARVVDQNDGVGAVVAEIAVRAAGQIPELVKIGRDPAEPHDSQFGQVRVQPATGGGHPRPSIANGLEPRASLSQLTNEVRRVQVAAGLAGREEDSQSGMGHAAEYKAKRRKAEGERGEREKGRGGEGEKGAVIVTWRIAGMASDGMAL